MFSRGWERHGRVSSGRVSQGGYGKARSVAFGSGKAVLVCSGSARWGMEWSVKAVVLRRGAAVFGAVAYGLARRSWQGTLVFG